VSPIPDHEVRRLRAVAEDEAHLIRLIARRETGEPLQYLEGSAAFGPFDLAVDRRVLIPRPETEGLWELARSLAPDPALIVDLCTGSGALAIALAHSFPSARVIGTDLSGEALDVARGNGASLAPGVEWRAGDLFDALDRGLVGKVDLIVSNPPYVGEGEWDDLPADVRNEPKTALIGGITGLEVLARIAGEAQRWLSPGGWIVCEIGETQRAAVLGLFDGYREVRVTRDLSGRDRYLVAGR
jgi:release factor glutamine methyltransferase